MIPRLIKALFLGEGGLAAQARLAYEAKLNAENDEDRRDAEITLQRIQAAQAIAQIEAADRLSAARIGRLLIVVPFGLWYSAIIVDSIIDAPWDILALPPQIMDLSLYLIPAILLGDVSQSALRWWRAPRS